MLSKVEHSIKLSFKILLPGLERWLRLRVLPTLFQRTRVQHPAPTWQFVTVTPVPEGEEDGVSKTLSGFCRYKAHMRSTDMHTGGEVTAQSCAQHSHLPTFPMYQFTFTFLL